MIDDNQSVCHSLELLFHSVYGEQFDIITYSNPVLFLEAFSPAWEGCLIIDLFMPYWNGIDLMKELMRRNCRMRYIITSGHGNANVAAQSVRAGASAFLSKPFNVDNLLVRLNSILSSRVIGGSKPLEKNNETEPSINAS